MATSNKKWTVFRRGESLGSFTAAEIREELRKGVLSPNDFAAAEDSVVQQEIIEIDEIFWTGGAGSPAFIDPDGKSRPSRGRPKEDLDSIPVTRPKNVKIYPVVGRDQNRRQRRRNGGMGAGGATDGPNMDPSAGRKDATLIVILVGALLAMAVAGLILFLRARPPGQ